MKNLTNCLALLATLTLGTIRVHSQTFQTNIVRMLNIQLTAYVQTPDSTLKIMRIANKDILNAILTDAGTNSGVTFTAQSKLLVSVPVGSGGSTFTILVRTGTNDTDVTAFFTESQIGDLLFQTRGSGTTEFSIQHITFSSEPMSFDVQGFTTSNVVLVKDRRGHPVDFSTLDVNAMAGTGSVGGNTAVLTGKINVTAPHVELQIP
jgi:hypothetical protein